MEKNYFKKLGFLLMFAFISANVFAQKGGISGKVVDENNLPLPGASVSVDGTSTSTQTDVDGKYRLTNVNYGNVSVTVKFIGYENATKTINLSSGAATLDFKLLPSSKSLNEVVVIGYGAVKKSDLTGAVTNVTSKDFVQGQITSPDQLITGKVAGVRITSNSGAPGAGSTIRIRGGASLNASNDPLIVIDGVPLDGGGVAGSANALALINPNDIESFSVLKDASATAIYGSRGSNGVIIITTKKGQTGKPQIVFGTQYSMGKIAKKANILSPDEFINLVQTTTSPLATPELKALLGTNKTDWQNAIYQDAATSDNNLSISGSLKNLPYRISGGYLAQDGILKTDNLKRKSLAINLSPQLFNKSLKVNLNLKGSSSNFRFADQGAIGAAANFDPTKPVMSGNSNYGGYYQILGSSPADPTTGVTGLNTLAPRNPLGLLEQRDNSSKVLRSLGSLQLDYTFPFLKELRANLNLGYDIAKGTGTNITYPDAATAYLRFADANGVYRSGVNDYYKQTKSSKVADFYLNYVKDLKSIKSNINVTAGTSYLDYLSTNYNYADYSYDGVLRPNSDPPHPFDKPENRLLSYYGRAIYTYNDKYILTGTMRADGSSKFAPNNRWGYFPSGAFAWRISSEKFMSKVKAISDLKLRLGYGVTGQQDGSFGNYTYYNGYNISNATAQYQLGNQFYDMYRPAAYNPNLKWEQTASTNIGLDFGLFNNRVSGSVDYYIKKTTNLLNSITQPAGTNFINTFIANVGEMENHGLEFSVNASAVDHKDFKLNFALNGTFNQNKITKLTNVTDPNYIGVQIGNISGGTGNTILIHSTGFPRASFYVYQQVYDTNGKPIEDVYVDRNGDGKITSADLYRYKNPDAKALLGFSSNFTYKKWNGGFSMRASIGNYVYNNVASSTGTLRNIFNPLMYLNNGSRDVLNTNFEGAGTQFFLSDYYIQNASFLRMDNANIGYSFGKVIKGTGNLNANLSVSNVFVITKYKGIDPEIEGGIDNNFYPRPRTFSLGLNLTF